MGVDNSRNIGGQEFLGRKHYPFIVFGELHILTIFRSLVDDIPIRMELLGTKYCKIPIHTGGGLVPGCKQRSGRRKQRDS